MQRLVRNSSHITSAAAIISSRCCWSITMTHQPLHMMHRRHFASSALAPSSTPHVSCQQLIASRLNRSVLEHVAKYGFAVIDNVLDGGATPTTASALNSSDNADRSPPSTSPLADRLRSSILSLYISSQMTLNHTHLVSTINASLPGTPPKYEQRRDYIRKRSIHEADFTLQSNLTQGESEEQSFWRDFTQDRHAIDALNQHYSNTRQEKMWGWDPLPNGDELITFDKQTVKAQVCEGNDGCFPIHCDTHPSVDSRRLTAILYLNPSWSCSTDGGALRLYPFPRSAIDIAPSHNRLVLFDSTKMLHRVLPSRRQRVCISMWYWEKEEEWKKKRRLEQECIEEEKKHRHLYPTPDTATSLSKIVAESTSLSPAARDLAARRDWFEVGRLQAIRDIFAAHHMRDSSSELTLESLYQQDHLKQQYALLSHLLSSTYRLHLAKLYYQSEWFQSLEESHSSSHEIENQQHTENVQMLLLKHVEECEKLEAALKEKLIQLGQGLKRGNNINPEDALLAWKNWFPFPSPLPFQLPPYCSIVPESSNKEGFRIESANMIAVTHTTKKVVDWIG